MAKTVSLTVNLDDGAQIIVPFRKRYLKHAVYLVDDWDSDDGDIALLSILAYPAVWTIECALWERDYANIDSQATIEQISQFREKCYQNARRLVKKALIRRSYVMEDGPASKIARDGYKFTLVDHRGRVNATAFLREKDWKRVIETCALGEYHADAQKAILGLYITSIAMDLTFAILKRDYGKSPRDLFENSIASRENDDLDDSDARKANVIQSIVTPSKKRLLRCMA